MVALTRPVPITDEDFSLRYSKSNFCQVTKMDLSLFIDKITPLQRQTLFTLDGIQTIERLTVIPLKLDRAYVTPNKASVLETIHNNYMVYYCKTPTSKEMVGSLIRMMNRYIPAMCEEYMPYARHGDNILLDVLSCITKNEQREKTQSYNSQV